MSFDDKKKTKRRRRTIDHESNKRLNNKRFTTIKQLTIKAKRPIEEELKSGIQDVNLGKQTTINPNKKTSLVSVLFLTPSKIHH